MNLNLIKRTFTCIFGILILFSVIFFLPQKNFLCLNVIIFFLGFVAAREMSVMVYGKTVPLAVCSLLIPATAYFKPEYTELSLFVLVCIAFAKQIKKGEKDDFKNSVSEISSDLLVIIYPSYLLSFVTRFTVADSVNAYSIFLFLLLVFANDTFAYIFGMMFGKSNRGIVKVSPKKSTAGFVGGFIMCIFICIFYINIFSDELPSFLFFGQIVLGALASCTANIGDLTESVVKRCAGVKDSGKLIPGRGGVLDSIDSIITTAPLFYAVFVFMR